MLDPDPDEMNADPQPWELDLQSLFELYVHSYTHWLRPRKPPSPRIWAHIWYEGAIGQPR